MKKRTAVLLLIILAVLSGAVTWYLLVSINVQKPAALVFGIMISVSSKNPAMDIANVNPGNQSNCGGL